MKRIDRIITSLSLSLVCLLSFSCGGKRDQTLLFNIDSLVSKQENYLVASHAKLHKQATINGVSDDTLIMNEETWKKELEIFRQLQAINKPVNRSNYLIDDGLFDPSSNLTVKAFSAKTDLPVQYVRVFYQDLFSRPRKIEAFYQNKNILYSSSRLLTMEFENLGNQIVLTSYSVEGGQKMIMGDSVMFTIKGKIMVN